MSTRFETPANEPLLFLLFGGAIALAGVAVGWYGRRLAVERDPVLHAFLSAPEDDEPLTPEEAAVVAEGREAIARGEVVSWAEVKRAVHRTSA